jgi:adenylosuccinate synthase
VSLTVVVGGQYGSEGKGKLVSFLSSGHQEVAVVRSGGPNAGHTAEGALGRVLLRQLPSGATNPAARLFLGAGMQLELEVLRNEIEALDVSPSRLTIDPNAIIITPTDVQRENELDLRERIGSTLSGTGAAEARKVERHPTVQTAAHAPELAEYVGDVSSELDALLSQGLPVIVEGTQGAGLSLHHGPYPFVTSRDTTAAGFLAEVGLAPARVTDVVVVLRTYPIRVAGNSGPLEDVGWDDIAARAGYPTALAEYTTVTGRLRRVGEFDWALAEKAIRLNGATALALHGVDYLAYQDLGCASFDELSDVTRRFIQKLEDRLGVPVRFVFTGPAGDQMIDRGRKLDTDRPAFSVRGRRR